MKIKHQSCQGENGQVVLVVACVLPLLLGAASFALDLVYFHGVKQELQAAADTAALGGARRLFVGGTSAPDWMGATQQAQAVAAQNQAGRQALTQASVQVGYWNLSNSDAGLMPLPHTPGPYDVAAVAVTVSRSPGQNGGPVSTFFAGIWGRTSQSLSATAVAGTTSPSSVAIGEVFPFVMTQCMFDTYWNSSSSPPPAHSPPPPL